jgi:hypothetical protein
VKPGPLRTLRKAVVLSAERKTDNTEAYELGWSIRGVDQTEKRKLLSVMLQERE